MTELMVPVPYRILDRVQDTRDTFTWTLAPVDGQAAGFACAPGQFNMVYAFGVGEVPISICGDDRGEGRLKHTIRAVGNVTRRMAELDAGDVVGIRGPFGAPWPVAAREGDDIVVVAGGIGLAPLRPVLYHVLLQREKYGRLVLLYGARNPDELLYLDELETWRSRFDMDVELTVDHADRSWHGEVGVVTTLIPWARFDALQASAYVCGPEIMMRFVARALLDREMSADAIFLTMERNMKCAVAHCGHCQYGAHFVCKDGPVMSYQTVEPLFTLREV